MDRYAMRHSIDSDQFHRFTAIIVAMDEAFLAYHKQET
jgi:hypothetical protein